MEQPDLMSADPSMVSEDSNVPQRRIPRFFNDIEHSAEDLNDCDNTPPAPPQSRIRRVLLMLRDTLQTAFNSVGICRLYPRCLTRM